MLSRFLWWLQNDPNAPATFIQALSALISASVTVVLACITYKYMLLTTNDKTLANLTAAASLLWRTIRCTSLKNDLNLVGETNTVCA